MAEEDNSQDPTSPRGPVWDEEEEKRRWKEEYDSLKNELSNLTPENDVLGELDNMEAANTPLEVSNRRAEPRYTFKAQKEAKIYAHMGPRAFQILNISVGGVAFYSDASFQSGTNLLLSALGMVALDVDVVSCEIEETNPDFMEFQYLVRAKFSPRVNGHLVYVLAREMYLKQVKEATGA